MTDVVHLDPMIELAWWAGAVVLALSLGILITIVGIRFWRGARDRRRTRFLASWRTLLAQSLVEAPPALPAVAASDRMTFLLLWNSLQESLAGESREKLNQVARLAGMDQVARQMIEQGRLRERLMAIVTLGHLRERAAWDPLQRLAADDHAALSLAAARAMIRIDAARAMPVLAPLFGARSDWSFVKGTAILHDAGAELIAHPLARAAGAVPPEQAVRLIRYLEATRCANALPVVRRIAQSPATDDRVMAVCLHFFGQCQDPGDLDVIRAQLTHPNWQVRLQAASALGRMGTPEDEPRLIALLTDPEWWVRYRAAEALASLPFITRERLARIQADQTALQARDILTPFVAQLDRSR